MELYGINCLHINGRLTKDPEFKFAPNGHEYAIICLAKNFYDNKTKKQQPMYIDCFAYGAYLINAISSNLNYKKGATVVISGNIQGYNSRTNDSGESITTIKMNLNTIVHVEFPTIVKNEQNNNYNSNEPDMVNTTTPFD